MNHTLLVYGCVYDIARYTILLLSYLRIALGLLGKCNSERAESKEADGDSSFFGYLRGTILASIISVSRRAMLDSPVR